MLKNTNDQQTDRHLTGMMKTTPEPWERFGTTIRGAGRFICQVRHYPIEDDVAGDRSEDADARLIAAAPRLLRACKLAFETFGRGTNTDHERVAAMIELERARIEAEDK